MNITLKKLNSAIKKYHRNVLILLLYIIVTTCLCLITSSAYTTKESNHIIYYQYYSDFGECGIYTDSDDGELIPFVDAKFSPPQNAVFFHASSCKRSIDSKEACAIESIAITNPDRKIYVFLTEPPREFFRNSPFLKQLKSFHNVQLRRIELVEYAKRTALLSTMIRYVEDSNTYMKSSMRTSEMLKYIALLKWGGIVLDMDVMIVKSLNDLPKNWVCKESEFIIGTKMMALSMDDVGRDVVATAVKKISQHLKNKTFFYNRDILTAALRKICSSKTTENFTTASCGGMTIFDESHFYPIHRSAWKTFYGTGRHRLGGDPHAFTLWSSPFTSSRVSQHSYMAHLAMKHCPKTYEMYGEEFGA